MIIHSLDILLFLFGTSLFSMSSSNCCFLTCIQISQESDQVVWYSHLFQNLPQFIVIHTVKGFCIINKAEIDVFLEFCCFFVDPVEVGNLISDSSAFSKTSFNIWKLTVRILFRPGLENFEHYFTSMFDECNWAVVWAFFGIAFLWDCNENFTILDAIKNICDSWAQVNISLTKVWEKLIQILMDDCEGLKTSVFKIIADTIEIARELELEVKPEDITQLLQQVLEDWCQFWKKFYCEVYVIK